VFLVFGIFMAYSFNLAQEKSDEELKKEYAPILGEYAFDWDGQTFTLNFYVEGSALWADSGDGRPVTMKQAVENAFEFIAEDPINGTFKFRFSKDDQGKYSVCQVVNSGIGLDAQGKKKV
jgi:hypothetical protein